MHRKQGGRLPFHTQDGGEEKGRRSAVLSVNALVLAAVSTSMLLLGALVGEPPAGRAAAGCCSSCRRCRSAPVPAPQGCT